MKPGTIIINKARPDWGPGLILRESGQKVVIIFEDGELRTLVKTLPILEHIAFEQLAQDSLLREVVRRETEALVGVPPALQASLRQSWYGQIAGGADMFRSSGSNLGKNAQLAISRELQQHCILKSDRRYDQVIDYGRFIYKELSCKH